jgi:hypothetical protein
MSYLQYFSALWFAWHVFMRDGVSLIAYVPLQIRIINTVHG